MMTNLLMLQAFLFGMTLAIAIGPIALLIMNTAITHGYRAGFSCALGATMADFSFALAAFTGASILLPLLQAHRHGLQVLAALVLMLFALFMAHSSWRRRQAESPAISQRRHFFSTYALTVVNPLTIVAFAGLAAQLNTVASIQQALMLAASAAAGSGVVALLMAVMAASLGRVIAGSDWLRRLNLLSALGIFLFGAVSVARL